MADGVIESDKETERGVKDRLDWYRYKANQMRFLGHQHLHQGPAGVRRVPALGLDALRRQRLGLLRLRARRTCGRRSWRSWAQQGFGVLPYYEYAGSKGDRASATSAAASP